MPKFDEKSWNPNVFQKYLQKVPNTKLNEMIKSGVLYNNQSLASRLVDGVGGNYITEPIKGLLDGDVINYDGVQNVTGTSRKTYEQGKIVIGRMKGFEEKDFSAELTGEDWVKDIAGEVAEYFQGVDQDDLLAILKGIFAMADTAGAKFVAKHTNDISGTENPNVGATTLNKTTQKACGDHKGQFAFSFMHSEVATNLENLQLIDYLKYTDANGIQRDLGMATWNSKLVIIDDEMPSEFVEATYAVSKDTEVQAGKTYYTKSGSKYNVVASPTGNPSTSSYYEMTSEEHTLYTTYVMGRGFIEYADCGALVPNEMDRDAKTNGGKTMLITRQRKLFAPKYISFTKKSLATDSPTKEELATGTNWEIVNDGNTSSKTYINDKLIPVARIISRG